MRHRYLKKIGKYGAQLTIVPVWLACFVCGRHKQTENLSKAIGRWKQSRRNRRKNTSGKPGLLKLIKPFLMLTSGGRASSLRDDCPEAVIQISNSTIAAPQDGKPCREKQSCPYGQLCFAEKPLLSDSSFITCMENVRLVVSGWRAVLHSGR